LSIDDVVKTAGVPRPKLYRFFDDKVALFTAVSERAQQMVIDRLVPQFDLSGTALDLVRAVVGAYVSLIDERPNLFRFLIGSHFADGRSRAALLEGDKRLSEATAGLVATILRTRGGDTADLQYVAEALRGAVGLGVLRWLDAPTVSKEVLVEEMTIIVWGILSAVAVARGVALQPDDPLTPAPTVP
jgi:AcrR family transcriptional regulator